MLTDTEAKSIMNHLTQNNVSKEMTLGDILKAAMRNQYRTVRVYTMNRLSAVKAVREFAYANHIPNLQGLGAAKDFVEGSPLTLSEWEIEELNKILKPLNFGLLEYY